MGAFDKMKSSAAGGGFRGQATQSLLVTFEAADMANPRASSGEKDSFKVVHVRDGLGKKAGEHDVVRLGKWEKPAGGKDRPSLWDHLNGKNRVAAAKPGTVYLLEGCKRGSDGAIEARWVRNMGPALRSDKQLVAEAVMTKVVSVGENRDGTYSRSQFLYMVDATRAVRVGGKAHVADEVALSAAELDAEAMEASQANYAGKGRAAALDDAIKAAMADHFAGRPGFIIRVIEDEAQDKPYSIEFLRPDHVIEKPDGSREYKPYSPEEALEAFKSGERTGPWYEGTLSATTGLVEIIPYVRVRAGKSTAEKAVEQVIAAKAKNPAVKHPKDRTAEPYYGDVTLHAEDKTQFRACYMDSVTVLRTMDDANVEKAYYFWTDAAPMDRKKFADAELITDNISPELAAKYDALAVERGKYKPRDPKAEEAPAADENFGEDPTIESAASPAPGR